MIIRTSDRFKEGSKYYDKEVARLSATSYYEQKWYGHGVEMIAGVDEAGRGPLAGPVVAGAIILPKGTFIEGVNDSKKISEQKREMLYDYIIEHAVAWGIGIVEHEEIDQINILNAAKKAMKIAIKNLNPQPDVLLIDAETLDLDIEQEGIIKGDALSHSIAAASILAKVTRDRIILEYDKKYPQYGFAQHKGYGTAAHIEAIRKNGLTPIHRKSFCKNF